MTATDKNASERSSWWTERWFLASAGLVAVLVLLAVYVAGSTSGAAQPRSARPAPRASGVDGTTSPVVAGDPLRCGLPAGGQTVLTVAPLARWELVGSMAAPAAPASIGPERVLDGVRVCFAHSPLGALYAAVSLWAEGTALPNAEVIARLAANTPARATAITAARAQGSGDRLDSETKVQVAGFQFVSYAAGQAVINLAFRTQNGALASLPTTMQWTAGDWRYVIPPSGQAGLSQISDLTGFIAWQGA